MKIGIFTDTYKPQINGVVTSISILKKYIEEKGHEVHIYCPGNGPKEKNVHRYKSIPFPPYPEYQIALPSKVKIKNFDVIHVHSPFSLGILGLSFAKKNKIPVVGTFHTMYPEYLHYLKIPNFIQSAFKKMTWTYIKNYHNKLDMTIAPSNQAKNILIKKGIKNINVIGSGIEIPKKKSKNALRKKYRIPLDEKIILHVGRVTKEKKIDFIIKSLKKLLKSEKVRMVITSDGPYIKKIKKLVDDEGLSNKIVFTGYITDTELFDYYFMSDVFVMASETETQGLVLAEAASRDLPVVVIDSPVLSAFVRNTKSGRISNKKDFLINVKKVLDGEKFNPDKSQFNPREIAKRMINIYNVLRS